MSDTTYGLAGDDLSSSELDGEAVLLDFTTGHYFGLNTTGSALWRLLEAGPRSLSTLGGALAAHYGLEPSDVADDVRHFVDVLVEGELVAVTGEVETAGAEIAPPGPYLAPVVERYDKLDDLILSGE